MTDFFLPDTPAAEAEARYAALAAHIEAAPLPAGERIRSMVFDHNGEQWTATVGEQMRGEREVPQSSRRTRQGGMFDRAPIKRPLSDSATIIAIFRGHGCYRVITDGGARGTSRSFWENPFTIGDHAVRRGERFDA